MLASARGRAWRRTTASALPPVPGRNVGWAFTPAAKALRHRRTSGTMQASSPTKHRARALPGFAGYFRRKAAMHPSVCALRRIHLPLQGRLCKRLPPKRLPCKGLRSRAPPAADTARRSRCGGRRTRVCFSARSAMRAPQTGGWMRRKAQPEGCIAALQRRYPAKLARNLPYIRRGRCLHRPANPAIPQPPGGGRNRPPYIVAGIGRRQMNACCPSSPPAGR